MVRAVPAPLFALLVALVAGPFLAGCDKQSLETCEKVCRQYGSLKYHQTLTAKTVGRSPEEAARIREEGEARWKDMQGKKVFLLGLDNCVTECRTYYGRKEVACMEKVTTLSEADVCLKDD